MHESLKDKNYFGKKISVNFFAPKSGYRHEKTTCISAGHHIYIYIFHPKRENE